MRIDKLAWAAVVALATAAPVLTQQHEHPKAAAQGMDMAAMHCGGGMMPGMMQGRGMGMGGSRMMMQEMMGPPGPAMVLHHKTELGLSAAQVTQLETLQKQAEPVCKQHMQLGMTALSAANQLLEAPAPDFAAYSAKMKDAMAHMVEGHVAMAKAAVSARDVLTAEQRTKLQNMMEQMHKKQ